MTAKPTFKNIAEAVAPIAECIPPEHLPLLIALAERMAAERYRGWAAAAKPEARDPLLGCAIREQDIAHRVESLFADASSIQSTLLSDHPDIRHLGDRVFASVSLRDQFRIQAEGEHAGAATWRSLAKNAASTVGEAVDASEARRVFLECADLEEENARVLEALLGK